MTQEQINSPPAVIADIDLQALVDGQLPPAQLERVHRILRRDSIARARYHELCEQRRLLRAWWRQFS